MKSKGFKRLWSIVLTTCFISTIASQAMAETTQIGIKDLDAYLQSITSEDRQKLQSIQRLEDEEFKLGQESFKSSIGDFISIADQNTNRVKGLNVSDEVDLTSSSPIKVIVQFKQEPIGVLNSLKETKGLRGGYSQPSKLVEESHIRFRQQLFSGVRTFSMKNTIDIEREYKYAFNGVAMVLPANEVENLLKLDTVEAVFENKEVQVDPIINSDSNDIYNVNSINEENGQTDKDKLHEEGITGEGVKVGVIDTGIDYNHPDLKDVYKGGYDFVDADNDPMETTYDDWLAAGQPEDRSSKYYTDHGTHVSGIIAGTGKNDSKYAVNGVAPEVELYAYRVLGPYGSGLTSDVIAAIDQSIKDEMDVINLSLGAEINDPIDPTSIAINNAALAGVVPVVAAGNSGNGDSGSEMYTMSSPGTAPLAITVGAFGDEMMISKVEGIITTAGEETNINEVRVLSENYTSEIEDLQSSLEIEYVGIGDYWDYRDKDVEGKIVLVDRGVISLNEKIFMAKEFGAAAVIIINNNEEEGYIPYFLGKSSEFILGFNITKVQGDKIKKELETGTTTISFKNPGTFELEGSGVAVFSSRGPVRRTYDIKPEVVAPGVTIHSSVPAYINGPEYANDYEKAYSSMSGTSMASPYVAGVAALVLQANPEYTPEEVKLAIMNNADLLNEEYSVYDLGAGKVDMLQAVKADVNIGVKNEIITIEDDELVTLEEIGGDLSYGYVYRNNKASVLEKTIILENNSAEDKTFEVSVQYINEGLITKNAEVNGVELDIPETVSVKGNNVKETTATVNIPVEAEIGNYEGHVIFTNTKDSSEVYRIPFGVNYMLEGINEVLVSRHALTTRRDMNTYQMGYTDIGFSLNSSMEKVDIVLKNADTGEALGLLYSFEGFIEESYIYGLEGPFTGLYFPFTGNPDCPIDFSKTLAEPGRYEVEIVATGMTGKVFRKSEQFFIENILPQVTMNVPGGVYEVGEEGLDITGNVFDSQIEVYNKNGIDLGQDSNTVTSINYNNYQYDTLNVDADGNFKFNGKLAEGSDTTKITLSVSDYANNGIQDHPDFTYNLVKAGAPYVKLVSDKNNVKYGESFKVTLSQHNIPEGLQGEFTLNYDTGVFEIENIIVGTKDSKAESVNFEKEDLENGAKITLIKNEEIAVQGAEASQDLVEVQFKVKAEPEVYTKWIKEITIGEVSSTADVTINKFGQGINILPTYSQLVSGMYIDGFIPEGYPWMDFDRDHYNAGIEAYLLDKDGNRYDAKMIYDIRYQIDKLPVNAEEYELVTKIPGHFDRYINLGDLIDSYEGEEVGKSKNIFYPIFRGGDVNKDDVIDILDAVYIYENLGTNDRNGDINFDGIIDEKDMKFVQTNYQQINPWSKTNNKPATVHNGLTLEDIITLMNGGEVITGDQKAANVVIQLIESINTPVTLAEETAIKAARGGYDGLTEAQKALVTNYEDLLAAEATLAELKAEADKEVADKEAAAKVIQAIEAIPEEITLEAEKAITAARSGYSGLTEDQKALVTNYGDLEAAEEALAEVKANAEKEAVDKAAANKVMEIIEALPKKITLKAENAIAAARKAYNELTEVQKALVGNYSKLQDAEIELQKLKAAQKDNTLPQTGAMAGASLMAMLGIVAVGAGTMGMKRRKCNKK